MSVLAWGKALRGEAIGLTLALGGALGCSSSYPPTPLDAAGEPRDAVSEQASTGGTGGTDAAVVDVAPEATSGTRDAAPSDEGSVDKPADTSAEGPLAVDARPDGSATDLRSDVGPPSDASTTPDPREQAGAFVAVGDHVHHIRSLDDGATWIDEGTLLPASMTGDLYGVRTVGWLNGRFVAFAAKVFTSPEGNAWTEVVKANQQWLGSMIYAQGQYVSAGGYGWLATTASDLGTWTQHPATTNYTAAHHARNGLCFGDVNGGSYIVTNDDGKVFRSSNAVSWTMATGIPAEPIGSTLGMATAYGGGVFVVLSNAGTTPYRSTDGGMTFTQAGTFPVGAAGLVYAQGHFSALANGHVYTSVDGSSWHDRVEASARAFDGGLAFGHGTYVGLTQGSTLRRSTDGGATWSVVHTVPSGAPDNLAWVAFGPGVR